MRRALLLVLVAGMPGVAPPRAAAGQSVDLRIVATTDVHGRIRGWDYFADTAESARGLARVAAIVDSVRRAFPDGTILLDAGDFLQGNPLTYVASRPDATAPHPVIAAMNTMRYDAVVLGNHEFNYGLPALDRMLAGAKFPVIAANVVRRDGRPRWPGVAWIERHGVRVAVIGETTEWSLISDKLNLQGKVEIGDIVASVRAQADSARRSGADVVIVLAHSGLDGGSGQGDGAASLPPENAMAAVAREVPGVDVIVFGHTHREVADTVINGVLLVQPRNWATSASVVSLRVDRAGGRWRVASKRGAIVRAAGHAEDPAVVAAVEAGHAAARAWANTVIGTTAVAWRTDSARTADTPVIDFIGETMRRATGADLASTAVFSTNVRMPAGPITVARLAQLYPYDNTIRVVRLSGERLKAFLERSAEYYKVTGEGAAAVAAPDPAFIGFNFEVVTGASYDIDLSRPRGDRVVNLAVRGRRVVPTDSFTVALSNYRASGTGGYGMVVGVPVVADDQREVRQLLIDEVTRRGTLRPEDYFTRSWRLVPARLAAMVQAALGRETDFEAVRAPARATVLRVISTNDFHGALEPRPDGNAGLRGGAAHVATAIRRIEADCRGTCASVLVDGGDEFQGTPASNLAFGRPVVALYNALGYAAAAIGNHDFDWGQDTLRARMREAKYGMFAANVTYAGGRPVPWIRADTLVERGGLKVGIIGLANVNTPTLTMPRNVADLRFHAPASIVNARAAALRARGADMVIVVAHAGASCSRDACTGDMADLARATRGSVDVIVGGHTHSEFTAVVAGVPLIRARSSGRSVAYVDVPVDRAARGNLAPREVFVGSDTLPADSAIARLVADATAPVQALVARPIVRVPETLRRNGPQYPLGNLIADAQRAATHADVAVMNNGGIRANLNAGEATYGAFFEIAPFGNLLVRVAVTGAELRAYFERVVSGRAVTTHVSGATVTYDPARPAGSRIVELMVAGQPVDPSRTYTLAMSDFMATGGDGYAIPGLDARAEATGIVDLDALLDYVRAMPDGVLKADPTARIREVARP
jgi:2',3'-cyclic-nucleotide 2'-phosphodiesterase/3'-nucleotidase/5'-nucleotidase